MKDTYIIALVGQNGKDAASIRLPTPGEEPLVVGSCIIRAIDLGDGDLMHEIRTAP